MNSGRGIDLALAEAVEELRQIGNRHVEAIRDDLAFLADAVAMDLAATAPEAAAYTLRQARARAEQIVAKHAAEARREVRDRIVNLALGAIAGLAAG